MSNPPSTDILEYKRKPDEGGSPIDFVHELTSQMNFIWRLWFSELVLKMPLVKVYSVPFNPAAVGAQTTSEQTVPVTGVRSGDIIYVNKPSHTAGIVLGNARVSASDTVAITFGNVTAAPVDPPEEIYTIIAIRTVA